MLAPRLLLLDDHAMFRAGLGLVIKSAMPSAELFEAGSLDKAMEVPAACVDVVLLDVQLEGLNGLECITPLKRKWPSARIVMLSSHSDAHTVRQAVSRGASVFVSKAESADRIIEAITAALLGQDEPAPAAHATSGQRGLTPRQCEVLGLLHQGLTNKLIARRLGLSDNTVRRHVQDILEFFQAGNRAEAVFAARKQGLVD